LAKAKQKDPSLSAKITGLCFVNDKTYPPVQAADLLSYTTTQELKRVFLKDEGPSELYANLTSKGGQPILFRRDNFIELADRLTVSGGND
jgi:hypothetical protein